MMARTRGEVFSNYLTQEIKFVKEIATVCVAIESTLKEGAEKNPLLVGEVKTHVEKITKELNDHLVEIRKVMTEYNNSK